VKFSYLKFPGEPSEAFPDKKSSLRPVIPVTFRHEGKSITLHCLMDSGADWCVFHAELATRLGLELKEGKKQKFYGTAKVEQWAYFHTVELNIGGWRYECYCAFSEDLKTPYGLLGQEGFFDKFQVKFDRVKEQIELKQYDHVVFKS